MRVQQPWAISVHKIGTVVERGSPGFEQSSGARLELWDLPTTRYARRPDGSTIQDPATVEGQAWICRVVGSDGRPLVEDLWSLVEGLYHRRLDADQLALATRLGRYIFDHGRWGPGRPEGRLTSINGIVDAIVEFRSANKGDPTQEDLVGMASIPYDDVRSLQRALDGLTWQDALDEASQIETDREAYPGKVVIRGFAHVTKGAR